MHTKLKELLTLALANKASDIHLMHGVQPKIRIDGGLMTVPNWSTVDDNLTDEMILSLLTEDQQNFVKKNKELDFSFDAIEARFRANVYWQKETLACALRIISPTIPSFDELHLPQILRSFLDYKRLY
jgi:twitching motility protein PilT